MLGSRKWPRFLMGAGIGMACGLTTVAAGVEESASDADGVAAFRRLVATASMRFPDDPTMRALILREADPSWSDAFSELAALELTEGAVPLIGLFESPLPVDAVVYDDIGKRIWSESLGFFHSAPIEDQGPLLRAETVPERLVVQADYPKLVADPRLGETWIHDGREIRLGLKSDGRIAVHPGGRVRDAGVATIDAVPIDGWSGVWIVRWSADGRQLLAVRWSSRSALSIIDAERGRTVFRSSLDSPIEDADFVPDGSRLVVETEDGTVIVDPSTGDGRPLSNDDQPEWSALVAPSIRKPVATSGALPTVSPDGRWRVEAADGSQRLRVVERATGREAGSTCLPEMSPLSDDQLHVRWLDDGRLRVHRRWGSSAPSDDWVMLWDVPDGESVSVQTGIEKIGWIEDAPQGDLTFIGTPYPDECRLWNRKSPSVAARVWLGGSGGTAVVWSPRGDRFAVFSRHSGAVRIHDADWSLRRRKLWDRIPAVLTPVQRMQYLGESPEEARRIWREQATRHR